MDNWEKVKKLRSLEILGEVPQGSSSNLQAPETAPFDKRITGRIKPLSLKATPEFHKELKKMATEKECLMIEILEKALEVYKKSLLSGKTSREHEKHRKKENQLGNGETSQKAKVKEVKQPIQKLSQFWKVDFECDKCCRKFEKGVVYSLASDLDQIKDYPTYCVNCVETEEETCSFREVDNKTKQYTFCDKPLFDKKKQLCRSHNRQVWKRFNAFTKDMSVSSTAAWLEAWDQLRDWKYWWNLAGEKNG